MLEVCNVRCIMLWDWEHNVFLYCQVSISDCQEYESACILLRSVHLVFNEMETSTMIYSRLFIELLKLTLGVNSELANFFYSGGFLELC